MTAKNTTDLTQQLENFKLNHYKSADFENINNKFEYLFNRFNRLKDKKKQNRVVLDLYVLYLQSMETLFINAYASSVSVDRFPSALFINSANLRKFISENFIKTTKFSNWFFTNQIFFIQAETKIRRSVFYSMQI
jgi:hypothetical protein